MMFENTWQTITTYIEPALSLLSFFFILSIWFISRYGQQRLYDKWLKQAKSGTDADNAVLIIDLSDKTDLKPKVLKYLNSQENLQTVPEDKILLISREGISEAGLLELRTELKENIKKVQKMGVDKLHLFYAGPVVVATIIGAELVNGIETHIYYHDNSKGYCNWGPVKAPTQF